MLTTRETRLMASERGWTLLELMIVCGIFGIATMMAVFSWMSATGPRELRRTTGELHSYMNSARLVAMGSNRSATATIAKVGSVYQVDVLDANGQRTLPIITLPPAILTMTLNGVAIDGATPLAQRQITYNSLGMRTSAGGVGNQLTVLFHKEGLQYSVVVFPQGKAKWCITSTCP